MPYRQKTLASRQLRDVVDSDVGATVSHSLTDADGVFDSATTTEAELLGLLDDLGTAVAALEAKVNTILDRLRHD